MSRSLVAGAALAALVLTGCSEDDPEPIVAPSVSASPTAEPTLSASPSTQPSASPVETVQQWVDARNQALRTGDTSPMKALMTPDCRGCGTFYEPIEELIAAGGSYTSGAWTTDGGRAKDGRTGSIIVTIGIQMAGGSTVPSAGAAPIQYGPQNRLVEFRLKPVTDGYAISFIGFLT